MDVEVVEDVEVVVDVEVVEDVVEVVVDVVGEIPKVTDTISSAFQPAKLVQEDPS